MSCRHIFASAASVLEVGIFLCFLMLRHSWDCDCRKVFIPRLPHCTQAQWVCPPLPEPEGASVPSFLDNYCVAVDVCLCVCVCLYACVCLCPLGHMRSRKRWRRLCYVSQHVALLACLTNVHRYLHMLWWMSHHLCCCMTTLDYRKWETLPSHYLLFYNFTFRLLKFCLARCYGSFRWFQLARF